METKFWPIERPTKSVPYMHGLICMLLGLPEEMVCEVLDVNKDRFRSRDIKQAISDLGYNQTNFIKFDRTTENPCLLRCKDLQSKNGSWFAFVYKDGMVYAPSWQYPYDIEYFENEYSWRMEMKITTMLKVWF